MIHFIILILFSLFNPLFFIYKGHFYLIIMKVCYLFAVDDYFRLVSEDKEVNGGKWVGVFFWSFVCQVKSHVKHMGSHYNKVALGKDDDDRVKMCVLVNLVFPQIKRLRPFKVKTRFCLYPLTDNLIHSIHFNLTLRLFCCI